MEDETAAKAERVAGNDAIFRDANEGIRRVAESFGMPALVPFICECAEPTCKQLVQLSLQEYSEVRSDPTFFVNLPGHEGRCPGLRPCSRRCRQVRRRSKDRPRRGGGQGSGPGGRRYGVMDELERRIGENEALFRQVNERIEALNQTFAKVTDRMTVVCECGDPACIEQIDITTQEYQELRADPTLFAVKPGYEKPDLIVGDIVARTDRFVVVKKPPVSPLSWRRPPIHDRRHGRADAQPGCSC